MIRKNFKKILFIFIGIQFFNCWQKQEHDINRPEIPRYILSGKTIDIDTQEILPKTTIKIQAGQLLYDVEFNTTIVESDSNGYFFIDPIYPGNYIITLKSGDSWHSTKKIEIAHTDRTMTIKVPKTIYANILLNKYTGHSSNEFYFPMENGAFAIDGSKCFINCNRVFGYVTNPAIAVFYSKWNNWYFEKPFTPVINYINIRKMTIGLDKIYISTKDDSMLTLNRWTGYPERTKKVSINLFGLTFNTTDKNLYACSHTEIYTLDPDDYSIINTFPAPSQYLNAMAFNKKIYTYDNNEYLLRLHDENMNVTATFVLINRDTEYQIQNIYDFDIDSNDNLWVMIK
ncbi:hypothetical protein JXQ31_20740 [candidate division KSB1 bacterium]|nr:hypothetical protein [candidate division KSB1 bacterium]